MTVAEPRWFGPPDRPLFGWVHRPDSDKARGAVVVCPSMGQEAIFSHYTLREVADELAELGFLAVRFDYDATGDSAGEHFDPDRVEAWLASVRCAADLAREHTDAPLTLMGMRLGALLAGTVAQDMDDIDGLVLWDAPRSGSAFVREQQFRMSVALDQTAAQGDLLTALGLSFHSKTLAAIKELRLRSASRTRARHVLVADRPGFASLPMSYRTLNDESPHRIVAADQDELMFRQVLPRKTQDEILAWFDRTFPADVLFDLRTVGATSQLALGSSTEHVVTLGPHGLFGIVNEPAKQAASTTVIFIPEYHTPHFGLSRSWTNLARAWSAMGVRCLRFDLSGCGDSQPRPGLVGHRIGILEHLDDVADVIRDISAQDTADVVLVGLCSGAYLGYEAALEFGVRGLAVINPADSFITKEYPPSSKRRAIKLTRAWVRRPFGPLAGRIAVRLVKPDYAPILTTDPTFDWGRSLEAGYWQNYLLRRFPRLPQFMWRIINSVLLTQQPHQLMRRIRANGTTVLFLAGDRDFQKATLGSRRPLAAMAAKGGLQLIQLDDLDHAIMRPRAAETMALFLTEYIHDLLIPERSTALTSRVPRIGRYRGGPVNDVTRADNRGAG